MSSKSSKRAETALTTLDAAAKGFTVAVPIAKPALKALNKYTPQNSLKRGDRAQASTLDILEDTAEIMEPYQHNILQKGFDQLQGTRSDLADLGRIEALMKWSKFREYATDAVILNKTTVTSSQAARSDNMWKRKTDRLLSSNGPERAPISDTKEAPMDCSRRADETASVDITSVYEDPFRETASVIVPDRTFDLAREPSMAESDSMYSVPGDIEHDESFCPYILRQPDVSR